MAVLLIDDVYIKENSTINENVDVKILEPTIIMVQDIYLQKLIGTPLYKDLQAKLTADETLTGYNDYKTLINDYITPVLLWYVKVELSVELKFKYMNKGVMVGSGENTTPADTGDVKYLVDKWRAIAENYSNLLVDYLKCNLDLFPKYNEYLNYGIKPQKTGYTMNVYLKDNEKFC